MGCVGSNPTLSATIKQAIFERCLRLKRSQKVVKKWPKSASGCTLGRGKDIDDGCAGWRVEAGKDARSRLQPLLQQPATFLVPQLGHLRVSLQAASNSGVDLARLEGAVRCVELREQTPFVG